MSATETSAPLDLIIVGGGLAGGLLAYRLRQRRRELRLKLIERETRLGGQHTWSFHAADLNEDEHAWIAPFVTRHWPRYTIAFGGGARILNTAYYSLRSEQYDEVLRGVLGPHPVPTGARDSRADDTPESRLLLGREATALEAGSVTLADGQVLRGRVVIDARGPLASAPVCASASAAQARPVPTEGYQKFLGLDVTLEVPHGLAAPRLMDATCEQRDGFRFFYCLPWSENRLLIEDTHYSDTPEIDLGAYRARILEYAAAQGWRVKSVDREEVGSLAIPFHDPSRRDRLTDGPPMIGARAGFFHPTTGYSLANAVRVADRLAELPELTSTAVAAVLRSLARELRGQNRFYCLLNRMLFRAAAPAKRARVLEHFHRHDDALVARFYSARLSRWDRVRILSGRPPVPLLKALPCFFAPGTVP